MQVDAMPESLDEKPNQHRAPIIRVGPIMINLLTHSVHTAEGEIALTALQFDLLVVLSERAGRLLSFSDLLSLLPRLQTGRKDPAVARYHVARLRTRLGLYGSLIENVRGCGYRLRALSQVRSTSQRASS